jgi:hypothetical protein
MSDGSAGISEPQFQDLWFVMYYVKILKQEFDTKLDLDLNEILKVFWPNFQEKLFLEEAIYPEWSDGMVPGMNMGLFDETYVRVLRTLLVLTKSHEGEFRTVESYKNKVELLIKSISEHTKRNNGRLKFEDTMGSHASEKSIYAKSLEDNDMTHWTSLDSQARDEIILSIMKSLYQ